MFTQIVEARAYPGFSVDVASADGTRARIDFRKLIAEGELFQKLRQEPAPFANAMRVGTRGTFLAWPDNVDFSSDSLWLRAKGRWIGEDATVEEMRAAFADYKEQRPKRRA